MIGHLAKQTARSLISDSDKWRKRYCCTLEHDHGFVLWIGNGIWSLRPHEMPEVYFNPFEKLYVFYALVCSGLLSYKTYLTLPFQLVLLWPDGIILKEDDRIKRQNVLSREEREVEAGLSLGGEQYKEAILEMLNSIQKNEALTSPNPVIRYYARKKWRHGSKEG